MLRIAIVDDEMAEIQKLQELVEQFFREKQVAIKSQVISAERLSWWRSSSAI